VYTLLILLMMSLFIIHPVLAEIDEYDETLSEIEFNATPGTDPISNLTPSPTPTQELTVIPTFEPTKVPTAEPTTEPTDTPTIEPTTTTITIEPTTQPTDIPTQEPTAFVTNEPTTQPTDTPTIEPTTTITIEPTTQPTDIPTQEPTAFVTSESTTQPTDTPTIEPTTIITTDPIEEPIFIPIVETITDPIVIPFEESGYFQINSEPVGADVTFDEIGRGPTPVIVIVPANGTASHSLLLQKGGYEDWTSVIDHNPPAGTTETIDATLSLLPPNGSISVTSSPTGATALLDGSAVGTTPCTFNDVTAGSHTVAISKDGYNPYSSTVQVNSGSETSVHAALSPVTSAGSLTVTSEPSGALILLNNVAYGYTNAYYDAIATGSYTLKLLKHGYQPVSTTIEIKPGTNTPVSAKLPLYFPPTGSLSIISEPNGGAVKIDGEMKGYTPLRIRGLRPDSYNVRVSIPGYLSWIGIVHVTAGRETSIYAPIAPTKPVTYSGSISITAEPSGSSVIIDGTPVGKTPVFVSNIAAGSHTIYLESPGYLPVTFVTQVFPGKTQYISPILTKEPVVNITPDLIRLSDNAAMYLKERGLTKALNAFNDPNSGFILDEMYVIALDMDGVILAHGKDKGLIGVNLSEFAGTNEVCSGMLMKNVAVTGGGLIYDTSLTSGEESQVSLVYIRPAISGVIIGTVMTIPDIVYPVPIEDAERMKDIVHNSVITARDQNIALMDQSSDDFSESLTSAGMALYPFERSITDDADLYGVRRSQILTAASESEGNFFWLLHKQEPDIMTLIPGYAEAIDTVWGIWTSSKPNQDDVIMMVDMDMADI